jgi:hypothetical protein
MAKRLRGAAAAKAKALADPASGDIAPAPEDPAAGVNKDFLAEVGTKFNLVVNHEVFRDLSDTWRIRNF